MSTDHRQWLALLDELMKPISTVTGKTLVKNSILL